jgi:hypothetical protein
MICHDLPHRLHKLPQIGHLENAADSAGRLPLSRDPWSEGLGLLHPFVLYLEPKLAIAIFIASHAPTNSLYGGCNDIRVLGINDLSRRVHAHCRFFPAHLDHRHTFIKSDCNTLLAALVSNTPGTFEAVV